VVNAQDTCADLGINPAGLWSVGACARACLAFVCDPQRVATNTDRLIDGIEIGYHDCKPGVYRDLTMYDVKGYYYALMRRLPSLHVEPTHDYLHWHPMRPDERGRWGDMLGAVEGNKPLRNSLVGCAMGASGYRGVWSRDEERPGKARKLVLRLPGGPHRGAGLVVIRTAWELCLLASRQTGSVYSTIDSVTTETGRIPTVWADHGFTVETKAHGLAVICRRGCWKVGNHATKPYTSEHRMMVAAPKPDDPSFWYHKLWLN
jgi:hypothetical protein